MKCYTGPRRKCYFSVFKVIADLPGIVGRGGKKKCLLQSCKYRSLMCCNRWKKKKKISTRTQSWEGTHLGVTVLSSFGSWHLHYFARPPLEHHEAVFAQGRALHRVRAGSPSIAGGEIDFIRHGWAGEMVAFPRNCAKKKKKKVCVCFFYNHGHRNISVRIG